MPSKTPIFRGGGRNPYYQNLVIFDALTQNPLRLQVYPCKSQITNRSVNLRFPNQSTIRSRNLRFPNPPTFRSRNLRFPNPPTFRSRNLRFPNPPKTCCDRIHSVKTYISSLCVLCAFSQNLCVKRSYR